jgi:hypothetical protein
MAGGGALTPGDFPVEPLAHDARPAIRSTSIWGNSAIEQFGFNTPLAGLAMPAKDSTSLARRAADVAKVARSSTTMPVRRQQGHCPAREAMRLGLRLFREAIDARAAGNLPAVQRRVHAIFFDDPAAGAVDEIGRPAS